jgi:ribosome-associated toxin RatA of RatAB toxin-antitoxin module
MHRIERSVWVPFSAERMFRLVEKVEDYPAFLPWCCGASRRPLADGTQEATIEIAYRGVRASFATCNESDFPRSLQLTLVKGPFRRLSGRWDFLDLPQEGCKVSLQLQYSFAGGLLSRMISPVFESIAGSMIDAFAKRAETLHGG